jgi:Family of unknown function (DUF5947)
MVRHPHPARGLAALRRLSAKPSAGERCELCAAALPEDHPHLVDPASRRLLCACDACAILFDHAAARRYRRLPRDVRQLSRLEISDPLWNSLGIPIGLVFFFRSSVSNQILAVYPSPGGPTEASIDEEAWNDVANLHCALETLAPDVEALLANRTRGEREYYIVPIDECYKLTGIIRRRWRGISGGDELWAQVRLFFDGLKQRARPEMSAGHA